MDWLTRLKEMKQTSGLTTKQIAEGSGIPEPTLEKLFAGATKEPKLPTMQQLVHFLGYTLDDLASTGQIKKSPAPAEPEAGESELELKLFRRALYDLGFLREGQKLTAAQAEVILSVLHILQVTLAETKPDEQGNKPRSTGSL